MNLYTSLAANFLFPLHEKLKRHSTIDVFRAMEKSQWLPVAELHELQVQRLKQFLISIGTEVPYYRDLFESLSFSPEAVTSLDALRDLPLMGKSEIRENSDLMKAEGAQGLRRFNTGGSSGEPLTFFLNNERVSHDVAAKRRATRWWGVDIGDPEIVVWGSPIELGAQDRLRKLRDRMFRTQLISAFEMSSANLEKFVNQIVETRPKMLFGYPSSLSVIAEFALERGVVMDNLGIRVAFTTSEMLYDHQKSVIQNVFGCPVANGYGGRDAGFIAHQCPSGSLHVTGEDIILEVLDDSGAPVAPGERGELFVTHMATGAFPFLRYRTGDIGALANPESSCPCGRSLPILESIEGRSTDFVIAKNGSIVHGLALIYVLRDLEGIKVFKVIQETLSEISVYIVRDGNYVNENDQAIETVFKDRLGEDVKVDIRHVSSLPEEKSGKFRYVVSKVVR